jgi:hypothetical protein
MTRILLALAAVLPGPATDAALVASADREGLRLTYRGGTRGV